MNSSLLSPQFVIGYVRIGTVEGASCINFGNNMPTNFASSKKHNEGLSIHGDRNTFTDLHSAVSDSDFIDMLQGGGTEEPPEWVKELMRAGLPQEAK